MRSNRMGLKDHTPPGRLFEIGGRQMHLYVTGETGPAVVVDCGVGDYTLGWSLVQREAGQFCRICTYDRAGYGWSEAGVKPRTSERVVQELHDLLAAAEIEPPYVLVGHSWGGINVRLFASRYPAEVAGMVLVDAGHEDQWKRLPAPVVRIQQANMAVWKALSFLSKCGLLETFGKKMGPPPIVKLLPPDIQPLYLAGYTGSFFDTMLDEFADMLSGFDQVRQSGGLGDMPLIVLSGGNFLDLTRVKLPKHFPLEEAKRDWINLQAALARLSTRGKHIVLEDCGHGIPVERPASVVAAIREVVQTVRKEAIH